MIIFKYTFGLVTPYTDASISCLWEHSRNIIHYLDLNIQKSPRHVQNFATKYNKI